MKLWKIKLLGDLCIERGGTVVRSFGTQKTGLLLAYLACNAEKRVAREALSELLWPESDAVSARTNLRVALYTLRKRLAALGDVEGDLLSSDKFTIQLNEPSALVDAVEFERACEAASIPAFDSARLDATLSAVTKYSGEFLPGFYDPWVIETRARLLERLYTLLREASRLSGQTGSLGEAIRYARQAIAMDDLREEAHLELIRLYFRSGRPSAAVKQFRALECALRNELGVQVSVETRLAVSALLQNRTAILGHTANPNGTEGANKVLARACQPRLPLQLSPFFGREEELNWLASAFRGRGARLVTVSGPPGCGKTRLAIEFGRQEVEVRSGAVWFVSLAEIVEPSLLFDRVLEAASQPADPSDGKPETGSTDSASLLDRIVNSIGDREALLLLDNAEHLLPAIVPLVGQLLARIPTLSCVVTSRQALATRGERELTLRPLSVPSLSAAREVLLKSASIALFVDRAQAVCPGFDLTDANAAIVQAICQGSDGLPLAIELAAAWLRSLAPKQVLERMNRRLDLLIGRTLDLPSRHRTLGQAIGWSVESLPATLQRAFSCFSVFRGGWTLDAAESLFERFAPDLCADSASPVERQALLALDELRSRSLIVAETLGENVRYRMYECLREYGTQMLACVDSHPDKTELARWHLWYYSLLAERSNKDLEGKSQLEGLARLTEEADNLDAALEFGLREEPANGLCLACDLSAYWTMRNRTRKGLAWLDVMTDALGADADPLIRDAPTPVRRIVAKAHNVRGRFGALHGDVGRSLIFHEASIAICRQINDREGEARAHGNLAMLFVRLQGFDEACVCADLAVRLSRDLNNEALLAEELGHLGAVAVMVGAINLAEECLKESASIANRLGDAWREGLAAFYLGELARLTGRGEEATILFERVRELAGSLGDLKRISVVARMSGVMQLENGQFELAAKLHLCAKRLLEMAGELDTPDTAEQVAALREQLRNTIGENAYDEIAHEVAQMDSRELVSIALSPDRAIQ